MSERDDEVWRKRLLVYSALRGMGLALLMAGVAIAFTDLVQKGGWPQLGAIIAIAGAIDALFAPRLLKKQWDREDREGE